jgi:hypothetical protein
MLFDGFKFAFFLGGGEGGTKENKLPSKRRTEQNQRNDPE